jgi:PAS domain S-box-containing protein
MADPSKPTDARIAPPPRDAERTHWRMLVEQLPAVIWTTDRDLRFTSSNGAGLAALGLAPDQVVGQLVGDFRSDGGHATLDAHTRALRGESVTYVDAFAGHHYRSRVDPLRDGDGRIIGCIGVAHDVTDVHLAEQRLIDLNADLERRVAQRTEELRRSEALFRGLSEQMPDPLFLVDLEDEACPCRVLLVNEAASRRLGYRVDELIDRSILDFEDEPTREGSADRVARLKAGETLVFEGQMVHRDGELIPLEAGVRGVEVGGRRLALAILRDLTHRREAEKRLRLVQSAVDQVADAVTITDAILDPPGPQIIYVNPAFERMTGYTRAEILGSTPRRLHGPRTSRAVLDRLRDRLQSGRPFHGETYNYRKDGSEFIMEWRVAPIRDDWGRITHYVAIQRDVTFQRRAEELAEQHRTELTHVARLSTLGEMASGLAHELNQPLAAIANYTRGCLRRIASGSAGDSDIRDALERAAAQAERAGQIIQRMRRFARKRETPRSNTDLNNLVQEAVALIEPEARLREVRLAVELAGGLPTLLIDPIQLEQVVLNLVRNAMDAVANNAIEDRVVAVSTARRGDGGVEVRVCDRGEGVSDEQMHQMFDPFYTTKPNGLGLGLTISRTIVEAHGGRLQASRNPDRGLTLHLLFPDEGRDRRSIRG